MRILFLAHGHPALSAGGGERAAYSLFEHCKQIETIEACAFVASAPRNTIGHDASIGAFRSRPDELLVSLPHLDHFTQMTANYDELRRIAAEIVAWHRPDLVHVHHFAN